MSLFTKEEVEIQSNVATLIKGLMIELKRVDDKRAERLKRYLSKMSFDMNLIKEEDAFDGSV